MESFDEILKIQRMLQEKTKRELEQDNYIELISLVNSLIPDIKKVQLEHVYIVAAQKGYSEEQVKEILRRYIKDGIIFQPNVGYIQREKNID